ncbi:MAG: hypothetical protein SGJ20_07870 [Planctomycetota bacterium]|nr:hypothetical protein [Planctomycetota bacterium]
MEFIDRVKKRRGVIEVEDQGRRREVDLATEPLDTQLPLDTPLPVA